MHALDPDGLASTPDSGAGRATATGARMLAATLALRGGCWPAPTGERAVELARFALDGDRLLDVDNGLFWLIAVDGAACSRTTTSG